MDPETIMDSLSGELNQALASMAQAGTVEEKIRYSELVKNLCDSLGVFLNLATDMMPFDFEE